MKLDRTKEQISRPVGHNTDMCQPLHRKGKGEDGKLESRDFSNEKVQLRTGQKHQNLKISKVCINIGRALLDKQPYLTEYSF